MKRRYILVAMFLFTAWVMHDAMKPDTASDAAQAATVAAPSIDNDTLARHCSLSIDDYLRDPQSAEYQWWDADVQTIGNNSTVILPVRAENAYGGHVTLEFICTMNGTEVVKVRRLK